MHSVPQEPDSQNGGLTGEEVVISGISGIFPNSENVLEFMDNLYNKVDMVTIDEPTFNHAELPRYSGKMSGVQKFDAHFFRVTKVQAQSMEPMCRKMMEQTYCAMYDAGVNPLLYKGKKVGVFTSSNFDQGHNSLFYSSVGNNFLITGASKAMIANRVSYWLDAKGPSFTSISLQGTTASLEHAYNCIKTGICEAAVIGGCEFVSDEIAAINSRYAGLLCLDGKTKCFDKNGDGCARSQAMCVLFLQKAKHAKRIYAEVCKIKTEYSFKNGAEFNQIREPDVLVDFLEDIYYGLGVSPDVVEYVEANGAANPIADSNELEAIGQVFGKNKTIKVGCLKSNMGNNESYSGACALIKLCLAYQTGKIAGNLHYNDPLDIPSIKEGKVEVVTENTSFSRGFTAINNFPFDGSNGHVVLKGHYKPKNLNTYKSSIPHLVLISARHDKGVEKIFNYSRSKPIDPEYIAMLNNFYEVNTPGFTYRGYTILDTKDEKTVSLAKSSQLFQGARRPLWFVYSGMGSQWPGMGIELMRVPIFAAAIEKCQKILEPKGVDLVRILTEKDKTIFDNVLNSFVGIAAIQIGLTDILKEMGLVPDFVIGHSLGEMGCGYCDGSFTAEEMMLTAYARGLVSTECDFIKGSMAAVGLGYKDILPLCPPEIDVACRNSFEFSTISGPTDVMKKFVADLTEKGVFAKEVSSGNIAYHSRYIQAAGPEFMKHLKNIIKTPKKRSKKWISTSVPEENRDDSIAELCSAEYHTNNLLNPVYFEEAVRQIPNDAVVVEIAPHSLMQAIMKRSHPICTHITITRRAHENPIKLLLEAFGKLHQEGYDLKANVLYPQIKYPVSTETAILSHLVEWYHEENWPIHLHATDKRREKVFCPSRILQISMLDDDFKFLEGHAREENFIFPEAAVLFYVWETLSMYMGINFREMSVCFHDVHFHAEVIMTLTETLYLKVSINKGNHNFEVTKANAVIASGNITTTILTNSDQNLEEVNIEKNQNDIQLGSDDVYKAMNLKGHFYKNDFKSICSSSPNCHTSQNKFSGNWITFLDSLIQLNILARNHRGLSIPKIIKKIIINANHLKIDDKEEVLLNTHFCETTGVTKCKGIMIDRIIFEDKPLIESPPDVLKPMADPEDNNQVENNHILKNSEIDYKLISTNTMGIKSLNWMEIKTGSGKYIKVHFAAPAIRDVQNLFGLAGPNRNFGMDFSGIDGKGNRVMGLVAGGALASQVEPDQHLLWPVPTHWSLEEAATVPLPYAHAFYCLTIRYYLQPEYTVFVTGGAGALGQAVISICLSLGCTVYTCVADIGKKQFLARLFPDLNENNIGYSRDSSFLNMVVLNSKNKLCNVVINCASGQLRELSMKCVNTFGFGHFLDVSDYDMKRNSNFGMCFLSGEKSYKHIDISGIFRPENLSEKELLHRMISEGIATGIVKPISHVVYSTADVDRAFRLLSLSRHRGRVLIKFSDSEKIRIIPSIVYSSNGTYIVICDEQIEQGIQLINYLVERGARYILFNLQSKKHACLLKTQITLWQDSGATVTFSTENLEIRKNLIDVVKITKTVHGIFVIQPKICDGINSKNNDMFTSLVNSLNEVSISHCPKLKYFIIIASNFKGSIDKTTLKLKRLCEKRVQLGFPALIILTEMLDDPERLNKIVSDVRPVSTKTAIKAMEICLRQNSTHAIAYNEDKEKTSTKCYSKMLSNIMGIPHLDTLDNTLHIKDVVSYDMIFEEIKHVIKNCCSLDLPIEHVKEMTIKSLKNLNNAVKRKEIEFDKNFEAFYSFIDPDVIVATEFYIPMLTMASWTEGKENLHAKAPNLLLLPGFEGHHQIFEPFCKKIKMRATTLQFGPNFSDDNIHDIALELTQRIKTRYTLEPKFYLLGYSFGVNVALEVAALLEKDGFVGVVFCLDSSPDAVRVQLDAYLGNLSEEQLQNAIINHFFKIMSKQCCKSLENDVRNSNSWDEKVAMCVEKLKNHVNYSNEYKKDLIETFYKRIGLARSFDPKLELESKIILLKGISHPNSKYLPADYGLSKYAKNPVKVVEINSDVVSAPYDNRAANFVNQFLDPALLEEFRTKNFCERYNVSIV